MFDNRKTERVNADNGVSSAQHKIANLIAMYAMKKKNRQQTYKLSARSGTYIHQHQTCVRKKKQFSVDQDLKLTKPRYWAPFVT